MTTAAEAPKAQPLRSRQAVAAALLLALAIGALAAAFVAFEWQGKRQSQLETTELYAQALEDQAATVVAATDGILRALAATVEQSSAPGPGTALTALLADGPRGRPFLRSVSWLDAQGRVLASSSPVDVGLKVPPSLLEPSRAPATGSRLAPLVSGRDIGDLAQVPLGQSRVLALPMLLAVETPVGRGQLLAVINPDYLATQFDRATNGKTLRALLLDLNGGFMTGTANVDIAPGTSLRALPAFSQHLPAREFASGVGPGSDGGTVVMAFRTTRQWPLVVVVEQPDAVLHEQLMPVAQGAVGFVITSWLLLALGTVAARRALLRDERLGRDLKSAHAATQASESRKLAILQSSLDAIVTIDAHGAVIEFNAAAEHMFGHRVADVLGQPMHQLIVPAHHRAAHQAGMARYLSTGVAHVLNRRIEVEALRADGSLFPVELTIVPVMAPDGQIFTATLRDITERQRVEQDLASARQRELQIGARIQQTLLVTAPTGNIAGLQISSYSQASQGIDGDFVEIIRVGPHCVDLIAGDVMGKGLAAAMMGAATKLQFSRSIAELVIQPQRGGQPPRPAEVVAAVHRAMTPALQSLEAFVTLSYLRIDTQRGCITWVGCGHEEILHVDAAGQATLLGNQHPPLGVLDDDAYIEEERALAHGDALFLCSDGVTDALRPDGERVGRDRVTRAATDRLLRHATPAAALHAMRADLLVQGAQLQDDVTMVVVQREPAGRHTARIELPLSLGALRQVRDFVNTQTAAAGLDEGAGGLLEVAAVEAFTNIVRHGQGLVDGAPAELLARQEGGALVLELTHLGDAFTPAAEAAETDFAAFPEGGFGMQIIHGASDAVQYLHDAGVNTVRMTKRIR